VRTPEEALEAARQRAAAHRREDPGSEGARTEDDPRKVTLKQLTLWALIEPEEFEVYSTRRFGAPITALKRLLIRLLRQYLGQVSAQQSRFNANVVAHMVAMEDRVQALEEAQRRAAANRDGEAR
jgi:hypothetical protein